MRTKLLATLLACTVGTSAASAATYDSRAAFDAATSATTTISFAGAVAPGQSDFYLQNFEYDDVAFSSPDELFVNSNTYSTSFSGANQLGSAYLEWQGSEPELLTIKLPTAVTAAGFDFADLVGTPAPYTISAGNVVATVTSGSSPTFFGATSNVPFDELSVSVPFTSSSGTYFYPALDNLSYGAIGPAVSAAPEPSTWALVIAGIAMLGGMLRFTRRRGSMASSAA